MALVEEGVRQRLRQRFSHLPEPVFNECLRTNPSNLDLCISQLRERSLGEGTPDPMCVAYAGMDPAHHHQQSEDSQANSLSTRENSDGWVKLDWPPMHPGGDMLNPPPPPSRTQEANEASTGGWRNFRDNTHLYSFRPPVPMQVSKISVNLRDGGNKQTSPTQPSNLSPIRTYGPGSGSRSPGTPESSGLDVSINLPGISPPLERSPSPLVNPFFPPIDDNALRASQSNGRSNFHEGRSSPGVMYPPGNSASPRHLPSNQNTSPSTQASLYNSNVAMPPSPAVVQPNVVSSHPVALRQVNSPSPDVRRRTPAHPTDAVRWADPVPQRPVVGYGAGAGHGCNAPVLVPSAYGATPSHQRPPTEGGDSPEHMQRMSSQEEAAYNQALIMHQNARKDRLDKDLAEEKGKLARMRSEIGTMELDLNAKRSHRSHYTSYDQLHKLREEKRQLQIDIECMNKEIELFKKQGYGCSDPQAIYFYDNMGSTGPNGPIPDGPPAPVSFEPAVAEREEGQQWSCTHCTFLNHPFLDKCECCEMPRDHV